MHRNVTNMHICPPNIYRISVCQIGNDNYNSVVDLYKQLQEFVVDNDVMIRVCPERFPLETFFILDISVHTEF